MRPSKIITEWAVQDMDPDGEDGPYGITTDRNSAVIQMYMRRHIAEDMGIPEELWPILLERTVEVYNGSWRQLDD